MQTEYSQLNWVFFWNRLLSLCKFTANRIAISYFVDCMGHINTQGSRFDKKKAKLHSCHIIGLCKWEKANGQKWSPMASIQTDGKLFGNRMYRLMFFTRHFKWLWRWKMEKRSMAKKRIWSHRSSQHIISYEWSQSFTTSSTCFSFMTRVCLIYSFNFLWLLGKL